MTLQLRYTKLTKIRCLSILENRKHTLRMPVQQYLSGGTYQDLVLTRNSGASANSSLRTHGSVRHMILFIHSHCTKVAPNSDPRRVRHENDVTR